MYNFKFSFLNIPRQLIVEKQFKPLSLIDELTHIRSAHTKEKKSKQTERRKHPSSRKTTEKFDSFESFVF